MGSLRVIAVLCLFWTSTAKSVDSHDVNGLFLVEDKNSKIEIYDCGDGSPCGRVVWINPDSLDPGETPESVRSKRGELVLGLKILSGFSRGKNDWRAGEIYSPEADKTYSSKLKRMDDKLLQVKGCIAFFCETQKWTKLD